MGLILVEPDLGTSLLFLPTLFAMVLAAGGRLRHVLLIIAIGLASVPVLYPLLKPYQQQRVKAMIAQVMGSDRYAQDIGFQGDRAMTLIGAGGLTGVGKAHAQALVENNRLPEEHNDMIFSVVCCRWGLLGGAAVWGTYLVFVLGALFTAGLCKDPFGRLVAVGIAAVTFAQMTINTGMNVGVLPITGMTLPFISYGGSSLVVTWLTVGLLLNIAMRRAHHLWRESFEFDDAK
jgi:rod shape determining protein RodA